MNGGRSRLPRSQIRRWCWWKNAFLKLLPKLSFPSIIWTGNSIQEITFSRLMRRGIAAVLTRSSPPQRDLKQKSAELQLPYREGTRRSDSLAEAVLVVNYISLLVVKMEVKRITYPYKPPCKCVVGVRRFCFKSLCGGEGLGQHCCYAFSCYSWDGDLFEGGIHNRFYKISPTI